MVQLSTLFAVAAGGACGAALRWLFGAWAARSFGPGFPWGTLGVNVLGCFAMGIAAVLLIERGGGASARLAPVLMTGLLGGFTTFSAFSLDTLMLIERGEGVRAALYVAASAGLSVGALWTGLTLARGIG